jgi:hypothetical protein
MHSDDFDQSLDGQSEFIYFKKGMEESLVATSEKVYFQNNSKLGKSSVDKGKKNLSTLKEDVEE